MPRETLKDYETHKIKVLIYFIKVLEALIVSSIGIIQYYFVYNSKIIYLFTEEIDNENKFQFYFFASYAVYQLIFIGLTMNALAHIFERIYLAGVWARSKLFGCLILVVCANCIIVSAFSKYLSIFFQWFSIRECFWRSKSQSVKIMYFAIRLNLYLIGLVFTIIIIAHKDITIDKISLYLCISLLVLYVARIILMMFMFYYCTQYNPDRTLKLHLNHDGFLRLEEMGSSTCSAGAVCRSTDLTHILKSHHVLHRPNKDCNPCYHLTCRKNFLIGFHQTTPEIALLIAKTGFKSGSTGMYGGGIYFARSIDHTDYKALSNGAVICVLVDIGKR